MSQDVAKTQYRSKVAIIGAGAAGTYTAWRLATNARRLGVSPHEILIADSFHIDGKPHIGGRLWSARFPGFSQIRSAELGGMRFLGSQLTVRSLVDHLKLPVVNFPVDSANTSYMLRGKLIRPRDFADPSKVPYNLAARERGLSPGALLSYGVESVVPNAPYLDSAEWRRVHGEFRFRDELLRDHGAWTLLQTVLSQDGFALAQAGSGYDTFTTNWNAADAMQWMMADFSPATQYLYVKDGFESLPRTLYRQAEELGVNYRHWRLVRWEFGGPGVCLTFDTGDAGEVLWEAEHLVLAMPRRSLELVGRPQCHYLDENVPSVTPERMFKFFIGYPYPWWRTLGASLGRTVTDGPLRQIYYWGANYQAFFPAGAQPPDSPQNSLIMIYCDGRDTGYWKPLFDAVKHDDWVRLARDGGAAPAASRWSEHSVNPNFRTLDIARHRGMKSVRALLAAIADQMMAAHAVAHIPEPSMLAYADWTVDPLGGAYNLWKPGKDSSEISRGMRTPYGRDRPVHIVGEAYSLRQGWVEGALQTAEQLCQEQFGLPRPDWLPANYLE